LDSHGAVDQYAEGVRSGRPNRIVRVAGMMSALPEEFAAEARDIGMSVVTTSLHDDYFMFIKLNYKMPESPTNRDQVALAELELRKRQHRAIGLFRALVPGCEHAFIARSSPSLCIRRGRVIACDYDITREDVLEGRHFRDDIFTYGFHDNAPRLQIRDGGTYGIPYRALCPLGIENLLVAGMLITSNHDAHMSTRNTVACMGQGQAAGHAAALCADRRTTIRGLDSTVLREELIAAGVFLEPRIG
ncbi:MAG: FAD-dependent oxidoreductase, partial [Spirochaetales bacterium]